MLMWKELPQIDCLPRNLGFHAFSPRCNEHVHRAMM
jgi:hypothetical protein